MLKRILISLSILGAFLFVAPGLVMAAKVDVFDGPCNDVTNASSAVCQDRASGRGINPLTGDQGILTIIINLLSVVVGIVAIIIIILAGLKFVTSGTNPQDVSNARERVIYASVALVIAGLAQVFVRFILERIVQS